MKDNLCAGCLMPVLHKMCPAHGSPLYCLSYEGVEIAYSDKIHKARKLSEFIHRNQKRWNGNSYFEDHICGVVKNAVGFCIKYKDYMSTYGGFQKFSETIMCLAYLHDTLEDCEPDDVAFLSESLEKDFNDILHFIKVLTRPKNKPYCDYIVDIANYYLECRIVKLADLDHNSMGLDKSKDRYSKYRLAHAIIEKSIGQW